MCSAIKIVLIEFLIRYISKLLRVYYINRLEKSNFKNT